MNAPGIRAAQRQHQTLTPRLQQAVRLLQLSSLDFAQEVNQAMGNNPFLELDEAPDAEAAAAAPGRHAPAQCERSPTPSGAEAPADAAPDQAWEGEGWSQYGTSRRNNGAEHDFD